MVKDMQEDKVNIFKVNTYVVMQLYKLNIHTKELKTKTKYMCIYIYMYVAMYMLMHILPMHKKHTSLYIRI